MKKIQMSVEKEKTARGKTLRRGRLLDAALAQGHFSKDFWGRESLRRGRLLDAALAQGHFSKIPLKNETGQDRLDLALRPCSSEDHLHSDNKKLTPICIDVKRWLFDVLLRKRGRPFRVHTVFPSNAPGGTRTRITHLVGMELCPLSYRGAFSNKSMILTYSQILAYMSSNVNLRQYQI